MGWLSLPTSGSVTWGRLWQILTLCSFGAVGWFSCSSLTTFNENEAARNAALGSQIEKGDKALSAEIEASAARQAEKLQAVGQALTAEIQTLRDRASEDRSNSSKLTDKVAQLSTDVEILKDRDERE